MSADRPATAAKHAIESQPANVRIRIVGLLIGFQYRQLHASGKHCYRRRTDRARVPFLACEVRLGFLGLVDHLHSFHGTCGPDGGPIWPSPYTCSWRNRLGHPRTVDCLFPGRVFSSPAGVIGSFLVLKALLGAWEAPTYPGAARAILRWVPKSERAFSNGTVITGSLFGSAITSPIISYLIVT
jgi:hypothetical protein